MDKQTLLDLFIKTREWRLHYRQSRKTDIETAYCACREAAIKDCMLALGMLTQDESLEMEKLKWTWTDKVKQIW